MFRLRWRKSLAFVMAAVLSGGNLISAATPVHVLPASMVQVTSAEHGHHDACCNTERHTGCGAACAAQSSCSLTFLMLPVRTTEAWRQTCDSALDSELQTIPEGITSLPESPPPRA